MMTSVKRFIDSDHAKCFVVNTYKIHVRSYLFETALFLISLFVPAWILFLVLAEPADFAYILSKAGAAPGF